MMTREKVYFDVATNQLHCEYVSGCVEVDKPISAAIHLLNQKGYVTSACCCGHPDELPYAYIQFGFGEMTPEYLPDGWQWDEDGQQMEYYYESFNEQEIHFVMKKLAEWAETIPDAKG